MLTSLSSAWTASLNIFAYFTLRPICSRRFRGTGSLCFLFRKENVVADGKWLNGAEYVRICPSLNHISQDLRYLLCFIRPQYTGIGMIVTWITSYILGSVSQDEVRLPSQVISRAKLVLLHPISEIRVENWIHRLNLFMDSLSALFRFSLNVRETAGLNSLTTSSSFLRWSPASSSVSARVLLAFLFRIIFTYIGLFFSQKSRFILSIALSQSVCKE